MEQKYWLRRKQASAALARTANSAEARLIHLDLAGRYSVKASACAAPAFAMAAAEAAAYYRQLEAGARFLASQASDEAERHRHLGMANHYVALALNAPDGAEA